MSGFIEGHVNQVVNAAYANSQAERETVQHVLKFMTGRVQEHAMQTRATASAFADDNDEATTALDLLTDKYLALGVEVFNGGVTDARLTEWAESEGLADRLNTKLGSMRVMAKTYSWKLRNPLDDLDSLMDKYPILRDRFLAGLGETRRTQPGGRREYIN